VNESQLAALRRLIAIARSDTGQSRRVANFLLAWWNAETCGGFDLTDLWSLDDEVGEDITTIVKFVSRNNWYPDKFVPRADIMCVIRVWRPGLIREDG
jgi:hypothetical protein